MLSILIIDYIKAAVLNGGDSSFWRWTSVSVSIVSILLIILSEIIVFKNKYLRPIPQNKNSSVDASPIKNKRQYPNLKDSIIDIKPNNPITLNTEKENMIK